MDLIIEKPGALLGARLSKSIPMGVPATFCDKTDPVSGQFCDVCLLQ